MKPSALILSRAVVPGANVSTCLPTPPSVAGSDDRQPVTFRWKAMLAAGRYVHPKTGQAFALSRGQLAGIADTHRRLRDEAGYKPFVPTSHVGGSTGREASARDNLGWVVDMAERDGVLYGLHQLVGADAASLAERNESSVYMVPEWRDSTGKVWHNVIEHNAVIPDPVLTGLGGFVDVPMSIAAARSAADRTEPRATERVPILQLSRGTTMDLLAELRKLLNLPEDATAEAAIAALAKKLDDKPADKVDDKPASDLPVAASRSTLDAATTEILRDRAETLLEDAEQRVTDGKWTPAQRDAFKGLILPNGNPNPLMLSRSADNAIVARQLVKLLDAPKAPKQREETPGQPAIAGAVALARSTPGTGDEDKTAAKVDADMAVWLKSQGVKPE